MKPITIESSGIQFSITEINKNKTFNCSACSDFSAERCTLKKRLSIGSNVRNLIATEIVLVIANMGKKAITAPSKAWEMVDSEGFSYGCFAFCDDHIPPRMVHPDRWEITPGSQVKFSLAFPELEEKINPVSLFFTGRPYIRIDMRKPTKKVEALLQAKEAFELERHTGRVLTRPSEK